MPKANQICREFRVVCRGDSIEDVMEAFSEASRRIKNGNVTGSDQNTDGAFYFAVNEDVPEKDWPI